MRRLVGAALAGAILVLVAPGCGVTAGDSLNLCEDNIPAACNSISTGAMVASRL